MQEIEQIKKKYTVLKTDESKLTRGMLGGGKIEETHRAKVFFAVGTNLNEIEKSLSATKLFQKIEPITYFLQIVSTNKFSPNLSAAFTEKYPFIKSILSYPF